MFVIVRRQTNRPVKGPVQRPIEKTKASKSNLTGLWAASNFYWNDEIHFDRFVAASWPVNCPLETGQFFMYSKSLGESHIGNSIKGRSVLCDTKTPNGTLA